MGYCVNENVCSRVPFFTPNLKRRRAKTMSNNAKKVTSKRAATAASKVLRDGRTGKASKTAAGSALSQRPNKKK